MSSPSGTTDGIFNYMLKLLADLLSESEAFQAFVGVDDESATKVADARARIGLYAQPAGIRDVTEESGLTGAFAVVDIDGPYYAHSVASGAGMTYAHTGSVVIHLESPVVLEGEETSVSDETAMTRMAETAGLIALDLQELSATGQRIVLHRIGKLEGPSISHEAEPHTVKPARVWYQLMGEVGV